MQCAGQLPWRLRTASAPCSACRPRRSATSSRVLGVVPTVGALLAFPLLIGARQGACPRVTSTAQSSRTVCLLPPHSATSRGIGAHHSVGDAFFCTRGGSAKGAEFDFAPPLVSQRPRPRPFKAPSHVLADWRQLITAGGAHEHGHDGGEAAASIAERLPGASASDVRGAHPRPFAARAGTDVVPLDRPRLLRNRGALLRHDVRVRVSSGMVLGLAACPVWMRACAARS